MMLEILRIPGMAAYLLSVLLGFTQFLVSSSSIPFTTFD